MAESPIVSRASADDVDYFSKRRYRDEHSRKLYVDLAQVAPTGVYVAKDEGTAIGIVIPHALEDEWFLSEMYVEPSFQKQGVGWSLLTEAAKGAGEFSRAGLLDPAELGGIAFFMRRGVSLQTPVLEISGSIPHENELARMAAGEYRFAAETLDPVGHRTALGALDREVRGSARPLDHLYFCESGRGVIFVRENEVAGYAYTWPSGRIGPIVAASQSYLVQFLAFALASVRQTFGAIWCTMLVPGTNLRVTRAAMKAGLNIDALQIFASDSAGSDLSRYVAFHTLLL